MDNECQCDNCKSACEHKPGWLLPGEAEKVAGHLNISLLQLFQDKLAVDWWVDEEDIFLLAPAIFGKLTGSEYPGNPEGRCIFFTDDGLCSIHPVKPFECRDSSHSDSSETTNKRHKETAMKWKTLQSQIVDLLKRKPIATPYHSFGSFL